MPITKARRTKRTATNRAADPVPALLHSLPSPNSEREMMARAAWSYYVEALTQNEIADRLGISRIRVNRILAQARECGIVQVRIDSPIKLEAEREIEKRFSIQKAILVPTPTDSSKLTQSIAHAAGIAISERLQPGMAVGVGWGRTLQLSVNSIERKHVGNISVVSLLGGLTRGSAMNSYETASRLADIFRADCYYIAAPAFADTEKMAKLFRSQSSVSDAFKHARKVDIALLSVGSLHRTSTMSRLGLINSDDMKSLRAAGAVGDFCAQWIDLNGNVINHPLNRRVIALPVEQLKDIPLVVLASGGMEKVPAIYGSLRTNSIDVLVTDEASGAAILGMKD